MTIEALPAELVEGPPHRHRSWRLAARNPSVIIGALIVAVLALLGALAPLLDTLPPSEINPVFRNKKPGAERVIRDSNGVEQKYVHRFGTDSLGRDVYSRVLYGARVSLIIGVTVAAISVAVAPME